VSLNGVSLVGHPELLQDAGPADAPIDLGTPAPAPPQRSAPRRRRLFALVAGLAALALLAAGVLSDDLHVRSELRQARSFLETTRSHLATTLRRLASVETNLTTITGKRDTLQVALSITAWELSGAAANLASTQANLASTQTNLANANTNLTLDGTNIATLNTCLAGVAQALNQISVGNQNGAVASMSAVASSCQAAQGQGKGGPVFPFDFPDPDVVRVGTIYYGYATNSATGNIQMIKSSDLAQWKVLGDALPHLAAWARPGGTWAPGVFELNGRFVLYYAAIDGLTGKQCISIAVAPQPQGPFVDSSTSPLICQLDRGGSIDPSPFLDAGGIPYLTWKSEGANGQPPTIWSQQLTADGTAVVGPGPAALLHPSQRWEGGVVEGPSVLLWSGRYYLFYSANNWDSADYAIGVALCQGPAGPCSKLFDHSFVSSQGTMSGPGGPSLFTDTQGGLWIAFHAWLPSAIGYPHSRLLFLRQVTFNNHLPVVQSTP
jgi:hypothetical protein